MCLTCASRKVGTCGADRTSASAAAAVRGQAYRAQQVLVRDHEADEVSPAHGLVHLLVAWGRGALVGGPAAGEQVGGQDHGHVPQGHPVLVLMEDHLTQEGQQGLKPEKHTRNRGNR